jgi:hypothetical protein
MGDFEMKRLALVLLILLPMSFALAADPTPPPVPIRLPAAPVVPTPPAPVPSPLTPTVLTADLLYVIDSDVACLIRTSPAGLVDVASDTGPIKIRGKFVDGTPGKSETRTYSGKFVYTLTAAATGKCELLIFPVGATKDSDIISRLLDCQLAPLPPPVPPIPPTPPTPPDPPDPFEAAAPAFRVLIVYESADLQKYPPAVLATLTSETWRKYVEPKGTWRCFDKDTDLTNSPAPFKKAMGKVDPSKLPYLFVGNGKTGFAGPMPANIDDLMALLKKFGG